MTFVAKHCLAAAVVVIGTVAFTALGYFALLAWAILGGGGLGGPLALPGMILMALAGSVASVVVLLFPVTAVSELLRRKLLRTNRFAEIPAATLLLVAMMAAALPRLDFDLALVLTAIELVLLGAYWWSLQITGQIIGMWRRLFAALRAPRMA